MLPWWFRMLARWWPKGPLQRFQLLLPARCWPYLSLAPGRGSQGACILSSWSRCPFLGPPSSVPPPSPAHLSCILHMGPEHIVSNGRILASDRLEIGHFRVVGGSHGLCPSGLRVPGTSRRQELLTELRGLAPINLHGLSGPPPFSTGCNAHTSQCPARPSGHICFLQHFQKCTGTPRQGGQSYQKSHTNGFQELPKAWIVEMQISKRQGQPVPYTRPSGARLPLGWVGPASQECPRTEAWAATGERGLPALAPCRFSGRLSELHDPALCTYWLTHPLCHCSGYLWVCGLPSSNHAPSPVPGVALDHGPAPSPWRLAGELGGVGLPTRGAKCRVRQGVAVLNVGQ